MLTILSCSLLLTVNPAAAPAVPVPFTAARFREHVAYLASDELQGRDVGSPGSAKAMQYLIRYFKEAGLKGIGDREEWYQEFSYGPQKKITARNVLAVFPGKGELAGQAIIVSCHHDHLGMNPELIKAGKDGIFNGADDNASGCAALLLLVQALAADRARLPVSHRTVIFVSFDAEERGLLGSRHYVSHPLWPLHKTTGNINFDMVGRLLRNKLVAADSMSSGFLQERVTALATDCGLRVETRLHGAGRADNASFIEQAIPAVHFNSGLHADYHQVSDETSKIDAEGGARISWLAYRLLREMMETPGRLQFRQPPPDFDVQGILRLVFKLGIIPEQNTQSGRYPTIQYVLPNSLAAKQGFQTKDEITSVNGQTFESLIDAALLFAKLRLDRDIRLTVMRKGKTVDLKIPAEMLKDFAGPAVRPLGQDRYEVLFRYRPTKKVDSVALAGTFNNWDAKALPMEGPDKEGYYTVKRTIQRGFYEYKFVINGKEMIIDPTNLRTSGARGNSVLTLDAQ
jgi:hypothetical protein